MSDEMAEAERVAGSFPATIRSRVAGGKADIHAEVIQQPVGIEAQKISLVQQHVGLEWAGQKGDIRQIERNRDQWIKCRRCVGSAGQGNQKYPFAGQCVQGVINEASGAAIIGVASGIYVVGSAQPLKK